MRSSTAFWTKMLLSACAAMPCLRYACSQGFLSLLTAGVATGAAGEVRAAVDGLGEGKDSADEGKDAAPSR